MINDGAGEDEEDPTMEVTVNAGPVYDHRHQTNDNSILGYQCSAFPDVFCFGCRFCMLSKATDPGKEDALRGIENLIDECATRRFDLLTTTAAVKKQYDIHVRPSVEYKDKHGKIHIQPEWSMSSIERHILSIPAGLFFFNNIHTHHLQGILMIESSRLLDLDAMKIIESNKAAYITTLREYGTWQKTLGFLEDKKHARGKSNYRGADDTPFYTGVRRNNSSKSHAGKTSKSLSPSVVRSLSPVSKRRGSPSKNLSVANRSHNIPRVI